MAVQYDARRDRQGWTVFDRWTGRTVILARTSQAGLSWRDARELLERLNRRDPDGDRSLLQ